MILICIPWKSETMNVDHNIIIYYIITYTHTCTKCIMSTLHRHTRVLSLELINIHNNYAHSERRVFCRQMWWWYVRWIVTAVSVKAHSKDHFTREYLFPAWVWWPFALRTPRRVQMVVTSGYTVSTTLNVSTSQRDMRYWFFWLFSAVFTHSSAWK